MRKIAPYSQDLRNIRTNAHLDPTSKGLEAGTVGLLRKLRSITPQAGVMPPAPKKVALSAALKPKVKLPGLKKF